MGDLTDKQTSMPVQMVGGGSDGESNCGNITDNEEQSVSDVLDNGGDSSDLVVGTTPVEVKVGGSRRTLRKTVILQPKDSGFTYGFNNSNILHEIYKNQTVILPVGENTEVWVVNTSASKTITISELS